MWLPTQGKYSAPDSSNPSSLGAWETWYGPLTNGPRRGPVAITKDFDSTGELFPKRECNAASVTSPDLREVALLVN
jgi:hypothetical protein